jgi:hypothetical protein
MSTRAAPIAIAAVTGIAVATVITALPAGASSSRTVQCHGSAEFCGATVSLADGFSDRTVTIGLTDTDFGPKPAAVRLIDATGGSYAISKPRFEEGGSLYVFTLRSVKGNSSGARLVLLFSAGRKQPIPH